MVGRYKSVQVIREQFPIWTAAAKSCRRCQLDTIDSAVVDFNGRCFPHCHYVSLSRVKKMESRFIRDLNEKNIHVDATVVEEMQRLQKNMKLITTSFKVLSEPSNYFTVYYQNVRSFNKHYSWNCCRRFQYVWKLKRHSWKISSTFSKLYTTNFKTNKRI